MTETMRIARRRTCVCACVKDLVNATQRWRARVRKAPARRGLDDVDVTDDREPGPPTGVGPMAARSSLVDSEISRVCVRGSNRDWWVLFSRERERRDDDDETQNDSPNMDL